MPRKTRKELVEVDEEQVRVEREALYRLLQRELRRAWRTGKDVLLPGALPEVEGSPSVL